MGSTRPSHHVEVITLQEGCKPIAHNITHICTARQKCNDSVNNSGHIVSNSRVIREQWIEKDVKGRDHGLILGHKPASVCKNWGKPRKILRIIGVTAQIRTVHLSVRPSSRKLQPHCIVSFIYVHASWQYVPVVSIFHRYVLVFGSKVSFNPFI
jgi:hypothetical protein